ncbi:MAG: hypothetical protein PVG53_02845, partial [Holophagae bacterium]
SYAGQLAPALAYYRGDEMDDPEGALVVLDEVLEHTTDPEARFTIGTAMFPLSAEIGEPMDLGTIAEELAAVRPLSFVEMIDIADMAVLHGQWQVGADYAEASLAKATPEAFLSDYPDEDYSSEEAAAKAERRRSMALADLGWALWNLGRKDEAEATFDEAMRLRTADYVGASDTHLDLFAGKMALAAGDPERAMELLAPSAVMGGDEDAMAVYREAYVAGHGNDEGLEAQIRSARQQLARTVDNFTLADYDGNQHDFSALSDGKVTLLAFWFPT